tara:strand:- start:544 stop:936 length:393 start_codon:yes stop_codon:yes gene_type:complete
MIMGLGVDIVEIKRIEYVYRKYGLKFLKKILSNYEIEKISIINSPKLLMQKIATRFAAKEAVIKSFSSEKYKPTFHDFEILKLETNKPYVNFRHLSKVNNTVISKNNYKIDISLSHENKYAVAFATLSKL